VGSSYRQTELARARTEQAAARCRYDMAVTRKAKREAASDIEFWGNKAAFLSNIRFGAFDDERTNTSTGGYGR
jgi:hypothetical protein